MKTSLNKIVISLGLVMGVSAYASADISPTAVLKFSDGVTACVIGEDSSTVTGCLYDVVATNVSYFGMDTSGDGAIQDGEKIVLTGTGNGITIGNAQAVGEIDQTWSFGGAAGNHFTTQGLSVVSGTGNTAVLDMNGWTVQWNGGPIDMGNGLIGGAGGFASITCATDCTRGDSFVLDYEAHVGSGAFYGFLYTVHLEGYIDFSTANVELAVQGGNIQECAASGGSNVTINTDVFVDISDSVSSISWAVDGNSVSSGETLSTFLTLGQHEIIATVLTTSGGEASSSVTINIVDTVAPVITSVGFINRFTGLPATTLEQYNLLEVDIQVDEVCDPSPVIQAVRGTATNNGDVVWLFTYNSQILTWQDEIYLMAVAKDQSNNISSKITTNPIYAP